MIMNIKSFSSYEYYNEKENVNEYLKLSNDADKQQLQRIKAVFEKKNLKSAQVLNIYKG